MDAWSSISGFAFLIVSIEPRSRFSPRYIRSTLATDMVTSPCDHGSLVEDPVEGLAGVFLMEIVVDQVAQSGWALGFSLWTRRAWFPGVIYPGW